MARVRDLDLGNIEPSARFRRFIESDEIDRSRDLHFAGVPGWSASQRFKADFEPSFDPFGWNDLARDNWPGYVALCALHEVGADESLNEFIAVDAAHPDCPVYVWQHEVPKFVELAPSLDAFLAGLVEAGQKLPIEELDTTLAEAITRAQAAFEAGDDERVLTVLKGPLALCGGELPGRFQELAGRCFGLQGRALERLRRIEDAARAYERASNLGMDRHAQRRLVELHLTVLGDLDVAIGAAESYRFVDFVYAQRALVEAHLRKGEPKQARTYLEVLHEELELNQPDKLAQVRSWLEEAAGKGDASAREFLRWFVPLSAAGLSPEALAENRRWWDELPRYGSFWQSILREKIGLAPEAEPSDAALLKMFKIRWLTLDSELDVQDVTPLARLTALQSLELHGTLTTLAPLRDAQQLTEVKVNDEEIRNLRLPNPHDARLLEAARDKDHAGVLAALDAGANPNAKDNHRRRLRSALDYLLEHVSDPSDEGFDTAKLLIERGAYPFVDEGRGPRPPGCYGAARETLEAWLAETGRKPRSSPFREWHAQNKEGNARFLELETAGGEEVDKHATLTPGAAYVAAASRDGGSRLLDLHTVYLSWFCIVSPRLRAFLSERQGGLEFAPIELRAGNRVLAQDHSVMTVPVLDCLDEAQSDPIYEYGEIDDVRQLVIDEAKVAADIQIFRVKTFPDVLVVRAGLAEALVAAGFDALDLRLPR